MGAVWMCARSQLRARGRAMVVLALLLGLMAGAATAAAVGARRTETAYLRFFERYRPSDVSLSTGGDPQTDQIFERISRMPLVRSTTRASFFFLSVRTTLGKEVAFPDVFLIAGPAGGLGRHKIISGRDLHPDAENEAIANYAMAERLGLRPGDRVTIRLQNRPGEPLSQSIAVTVVGVSAYVGGFESATGGGFTTTFQTTPAFGRRWLAYGSKGEDNLGVFLRRGEADADAFERELAAQKIPTDGPPSARARSPRAFRT